MEDVVTVKVAFQEKTQTNAISNLTLRYGSRITTAMNCLPPSFYLSSFFLFLGTATSWQVVADD